jgi:hypothetical protein
MAGYQTISNATGRNGPYRSVWELVSHTQLSQTAVENLASVGSFESLTANCRQHPMTA